MFCKYCGEKLDEKLLEEKGVIFCPKCGTENKKAKSGKKDNKKVSLEENETKEVVKTTEDASVAKALELANNPSVEAKVYHKDSGSVGLGILGFFIPIIGIILYFCLIRTSPRNANAAGAGALICIVLAIVAALVFVVITMFFNVRLPAEFYY